MAQVQQMTLEQIEAHIKQANLDQYLNPAAIGAAATRQDLAGTLKNVCGIYRGISPILAVIIKIPLIPHSIRGAIEKFMKAMDAICPSK